jgi:hypothetical protein
MWGYRCASQIPLECTECTEINPIHTSHTPLLTERRQSIRLTPFRRRALYANPLHVCNCIFKPALTDELF